MILITIWLQACKESTMAKQLLFSLSISLALIFTAAKKDILFIAVDDLRPELGCYGAETAITPNIDALAATSMVFERAYCQIAVCSPSRASLLTGRRPDTNHVWEISGNEYWRKFTNATTIPQYFKENGYVSIGMGKIFHPGAPSGDDDIKYSWSLPYFHGQNKPQMNHISWHSFVNISDNDLRDGQVGDKAIETLKEIKKNRTKGVQTPFFLATGFHKPHLPFFAPSKYYDMYPPAENIKLPKNPDAPKDIPPTSWSTSGELRNYMDMEKYNSPDCKKDAKASMAGESCRVSDSDSKLLRRGYHAAQSYTDAQIGRLLAELDNQGLADNTIIVLWADHGWKLGEHNMWTKHTNFEDDTHVPFILSVPGVTDSGMRTDALIELIDIFPTLTELTGLDSPPLCPEDNKDLLACVEGFSLVPLLKNPKQEWKRAAFSQYPRPTGGLSSIPGRPPFSNSEAVMGYAMRTDTYRFVEWYGFDHVTAKANFSDKWGTELYNHTMPVKFFNDENENLASDEKFADKVEEFRKMLQAGWRAVMPS